MKKGIMVVVAFVFMFSGVLFGYANAAETNKAKKSYTASDATKQKASALKKKFDVQKQQGTHNACTACDEVMAEVITEACVGGTCAVLEGTFDGICEALFGLPGFVLCPIAGVFVGGECNARGFIYVKNNFKPLAHEACVKMALCSK